MNRRNAKVLTRAAQERNERIASARARHKLLEGLKLTDEEQRAAWKHEAETYLKRLFLSQDPPILTLWGPDGFMIRDHRGRQTATLTWAEARRGDYPDWRKKAPVTVGAGIPGAGNRTPPAKAKPGRRAKAKARKRRKKK